MKKAFTMIELIFVIVILGILAAVAVPKLTATRDDAEMVKLIANTKQVINDIHSYYTAHGDLPVSGSGVDIQQLTNVKFGDWSNKNSAPTGGDINVGILYYKDKRCVVFSVFKSAEADQVQKRKMNGVGDVIAPRDPFFRVGKADDGVAEEGLCRKVWTQALDIPNGKDLRFYKLNSSSVAY